MKRRVLALLMAAVLLTLPLSARSSAAEQSLTFLSINDQIPAELVNARTFYNGRAYVPYTVFANYGLGIVYSYFSSAETAYFYAGEQHIFFELRTGDTYDAEGYHFSFPAIYWGGVVYVPLVLMCAYFGLRLSTITGSEYGEILRVTNGAENLTDEELRQAAGNYLRSLYERHNAAQPTESPAPTPQPTEEPETHAGEPLRLAFTGLPERGLLDALSRRGLRSVFFLTADEVRADPGLVRRICGEGHALGLCCPEEPMEDWTETRALLFAAARAVCLLLYVPEEGSEAAERLTAECGAVRYLPDYVLSAEEAGEYPAYRIIGWLEGTEIRSPSLLLPANAMSAGALEQVLWHILEQEYTFSCPRETDAKLTEGDITT